MRRGQNRRRMEEMRGKNTGSVPTSLHKHLSFVRNKMKASLDPSAVIKEKTFHEKDKNRKWLQNLAKDLKPTFRMQIA